MKEMIAIEMAAVVVAGLMYLRSRLKKIPAGAELIFQSWEACDNAKPAGMKTNSDKKQRPLCAGIPGFTSTNCQQ